MEARKQPRKWMQPLVITPAILLIALIFFSFSSRFFYFLERVEQDEVGVQFVSGRIKDVVGPGVYNDMGLFVEMRRVPSKAVAFQVSDEELITKDKQRIGLIVTGDIFRPGEEHKDILQSLWAKYNALYTDENAARERIENRARQAMKVCVGDRIFDEAVIGTARDDLRACIDEELNILASNFGLRVENVAVPEVLLSPQVQERLDEIVESRLQTEKAAQDKLKADAEAAAEQARQEGEIRILQSRMQEEARQQRTLANLDREKIEAQKAVIEAERANELARVEAERAIIEAEKANSLIAAELDLEIQTARAASAIEAAKAEVSVDLALAALYTDNPSYLQLKMVQSNADALQPSDKIIFAPEGMIPTLVMPGPGIMPTIDTSQIANNSTQPANLAASAGTLENQTSITSTEPSATSLSDPAVNEVGDTKP